MNLRNGGPNVSVGIGQSVVGIKRKSTVGKPVVVVATNNSASVTRYPNFEGYLPQTPYKGGLQEREAPMGA